jgi:tRNA threonylcarbamoyladenosine biosynthesis protein TsaB
VAREGHENLRPVLAIDTSSAQAAVALFDGQSLSTRSWSADRTHTTTLLSEIHHILEAAEIDAKDLGAIAIAIGPGAFTGLRVGFGVAKGLHLATGAPLIGISTLAATAYPFAWSGLPIVAVVTAGRGRIVWSRYAPAPDGVAETHGPRNGTIEELIADLAGSPPVVVAGELESAQAVTLRTNENVCVPPRLVRLRQPAALANIAWMRWQQGEVDDAAAIEPLYLSR